eukprot:scaffold208265_cov23-Prasinocladus_malaysianus.AAC.1
MLACLPWHIYWQLDGTTGRRGAIALLAYILSASIRPINLITLAVMVALSHPMIVATYVVVRNHFWAI